LQLEEGLSNFNNFWYEYSFHNTIHQMTSISRLTQRVSVDLVAYFLGNAEQAEYALK